MSLERTQKMLIEKLWTWAWDNVATFRRTYALILASKLLHPKNTYEHNDYKHEFLFSKLLLCSFSQIHRDLEKEWLAMIGKRSLKLCIDNGSMQTGVQNRLTNLHWKSFKIDFTTHSADLFLKSIPVLG